MLYHQLKEIVDNHNNRILEAISQYESMIPSLSYLNIPTGMEFLTNYFVDGRATYKGKRLDLSAIMADTAVDVDTWIAIEAQVRQVIAESDMSYLRWVKPEEYGIFHIWNCSNRIKQAAIIRERILQLKSQYIRMTHLPYFRQLYQASTKWNETYAAQERDVRPITDVQKVAYERRKARNAILFEERTRCRNIEIAKLVADINKCTYK